MHRSSLFFSFWSLVIYICVYVCIYIYICTYVHIYIYIKNRSEKAAVKDSNTGSAVEFQHFLWVFFSPEIFFLLFLIYLVLISSDSEAPWLWPKMSS